MITTGKIFQLIIVPVAKL